MTGAHVLSLSFVLAAAGCSVIVSEIELSCDDGCDALNQAEQLGAEACVIYQCRSDGKGCEKRERDKDDDGFPDALTCGDAGLPGPLDCQDDAGDRYPDATEACNGVDDNCDGVIDEGALDGGFTLDRAPGLMVRPRLTRAAHGTAVNAPLDLALSYEREDALDLWTEGSDAFAVDPLCVTEKSLTSVCTFGEIALASTATAVLAAGVNTNGCDIGQVRVGASIDRRAFTWEHAQDSALRLGIDPQTKSSGAICTAQSGAGRLSAAALLDEPPGGLHGLVLWRDAITWQREAGDLRGIDFGLALAPMLTKLSVSTTHAATSERLSAAPGSDPAALVPWPEPSDGGYFMAYDAQDSIELAFLPRRVTAAATLADRILRGKPIEGRAPRHVALALDGRATGAEALALAAAWREGDRLHFAAISHDPRRDPPLRAEQVVSIDNAAPALEGPAIVFDRAGFRAAPTAPAGGWYVLWLERDGARKRLVGTRIAQADPHHAEPPFVIDAQDELSFLFTYSSESKPAAVGFLAGAGQPDLHIGSLGCAATP